MKYLASSSLLKELGVLEGTERGLMQALDLIGNF